MSLGLCASASEPPLSVTFHHIHVNDSSITHLLSYYGKLFDPATTTATSIGDVRGITADGVSLLINPVREAPAESGGPVWHFGWGTLSLDEAYDRHRMQEIDLELPIASFAADLHLHLESEDPVRAATWYRDRLGATIAINGSNAKARPTNTIHRRPAAIVTLPRIALAIYQSADAVGPSRGRRIDHIGFKADLQDARRKAFKILEQSGRLGPFETMTIEGPDRLAIELVGPPLLSRPDEIQNGSGIPDPGSPIPDPRSPIPRFRTSP